MMLRDNIDPDRLEVEIKTKNVEMEMRIRNLEKTKKRVQREQEQMKVKEKNLQQFAEVSLILDMYEVPELSIECGNLAGAMIGIKNLGYDPNAIVAAYNKSESLIKENETAETRLHESEKIESYERKLEEQKARWADDYDAFEMFKRLKRDGLSGENVFMAVHVLKNDFTKKDIDQLMQDIRIYGSIAAARSKLQRQYEAETGTMLQNLDDV